MKNVQQNTEKNLTSITPESLEIIQDELVNAMCDDEILPEYRIKLKTAYEELNCMKDCL